MRAEVPNMTSMIASSCPSGFGPESPSPRRQFLTACRKTIEQDGATVYVDGMAADLLADKILDGGVDEEGNIQFALGQQA